MLAAGLVASSCAQPSRRSSLAALDRQQFEELLISDAPRAAEVTKAVGECMREHGFKIVSTTTPSTVPPASQAESGLAAVAEAQFEASDVTASSNRGTEPSAAYMETWQGSVTVNGKQYEGGCEAYARDRVDQSHPEQSQVDSLRVQYGEAMASVTASSEMSTLDEEWAACMARLGYSGLHKPGDQLERISNQLEAVDRNASHAKMAALLADVRRFDIAITGAYARCIASQEVKREALINGASERFRNEHAAELRGALGGR